MEKNCNTYRDMIVKDLFILGNKRVLKKIKKVVAIKNDRRIVAHMVKGNNKPKTYGGIDSFDREVCHLPDGKK